MIFLVFKEVKAAVTNKTGSVFSFCGACPKDTEGVTISKTIILLLGHFANVLFICIVFFYELSLISAFNTVE